MRTHSRLILTILSAFCVLFGASSAYAAGLDDLLGGLSWGASREQVEENYKATLIAEYRTAIEGSRDAVRNDRLRREVDTNFERFSSTWREFDGARTGYESSTIADEVYIGDNLAMLAVPDVDLPRYFVFRNNRLVKVIIATNVASLGNIDFQEFIDQMRRSYGRPQEVVTERDEYGIPTDVRAIWANRTTRLRVENKSQVFNTFLFAVTDASQPDFFRSQTETNEAARRASSSLDSLFTEVAADPTNRTRDDVVDRITGSSPQVQVRLRADARDGDSLTSRSQGTSTMRDDEVLQDVEKVERRSGRRSGSRSGGSSGSSSGSGGGGGVTIY